MNDDFESGTQNAPSTRCPNVTAVHTTKDCKRFDVMIRMFNACATPVGVLNKCDKLMHYIQINARDVIIPSMNVIIILLLLSELTTWLSLELTDDLSTSNICFVTEQIFIGLQLIQWSVIFVYLIYQS